MYFTTEITSFQYHKARTSFLYFISHLNSTDVQHTYQPTESLHLVSEIGSCAIKMRSTKNIGQEYQQTHTNPLSPNLQ